MDLIKFSIVKSTTYSQSFKKIAYLGSLILKVFLTLPIFRFFFLKIYFSLPFENHVFTNINLIINAQLTFIRLWSI